MYREEEKIIVLFNIQYSIFGRCQWLTSLIPAIQEEEIRRIKVKARVAK
jgi:hypothetical protein